PWNLVGGTIKGGTVSTVGQGQLTATVGSRLTAVTLVGQLSGQLSDSAALFASSVWLTVTEGGSGTNTVIVQAGSGETNFTLIASGSAVVGLGEITGLGMPEPDSISMGGSGSGVVNVRSTAEPTTITVANSGTDTVNLNSNAGPATINLAGSGTS